MVPMRPGEPGDKTMDQSRRGGSSGNRPNDANLPVPRRRPEPDAPILRKPRRPLPDFTGMEAPTFAGDGYTDFLPVAQQIVATPPSMLRRAVGYVACGILTLAFLCSILFNLRLFAVATGEIQARGGNQVVEPLEPGQISMIPVQNGARVAAGATVLQLDPTAARAAVTIAEAKLANARGDAFRRSVRRVPRAREGDGARRAARVAHGRPGRRPGPRGDGAARRPVPARRDPR